MGKERVENPATAARRQNSSNGTGVSSGPVKSRNMKPAQGSESRLSETADKKLKSDTRYESMQAVEITY